MVSQACPALTSSWVYLYKGPFEVADTTSLHALPERVESLATSSSQILNVEGSFPSQVDALLIYCSHEARGLLSKSVFSRLELFELIEFSILFIVA